VEVTYSLGEEVSEPLAVMKMETLVTERASFFLTDVDGENIQSQCSTIEEGSQGEGDAVHLPTAHLKGYKASHVDSVTAAVPQTASSTEWTLWFTPSQYRIKDVSVAISQVLLHRPSLGNQLTFDALLSMGVDALEAYGYDVSRILVAQKKEFRIAEDQRCKDQEVKLKLQAEGLLPISTGTSHLSFGIGNSFANESSISQASTLPSRHRGPSKDRLSTRSAPP
jgi:hypothetical protein